MSSSWYKLLEYTRSIYFFSKTFSLISFKIELLRRTRKSRLRRLPLDSGALDHCFFPGINFRPKPSQNYDQCNKINGYTPEKPSAVSKQYLQTTASLPSPVPQRRCAKAGGRGNLPFGVRLWKCQVKLSKTLIPKLWSGYVIFQQNYFVCVCVLGVGTGDWIQGLVQAGKALYYWATFHPSFYFWNRVSLNCPGWPELAVYSLDPLILLPHPHK